MNPPIPQLTNPRKEAMFDDWPFGNSRCRCKFYVETTNRGQRVCRQTENKAKTGWNRPKKTTYSKQFVIVDGDDDKTYLVGLGCPGSDSVDDAIVIWTSDCQHTLSTVFKHYEPEKFTELLALFE